MRLYDIKQNGFKILQARGKNNAVAVLKKHFSFEGIDAKAQKWINNCGEIQVNVDGHRYSIEENNND